VQAAQLFAQDVDAGLLRMSTKIGVPMAACLAGRRRGGAGVEGAGRTTAGWMRISWHGCVTLDATRPSTGRMKTSGGRWPGSRRCSCGCSACHIRCGAPRTCCTRSGSPRPRAERRIELLCPASRLPLFG